jgi:hypothetical protein
VVSRAAPRPNTAATAATAATVAIDVLGGVAGLLQVMLLKAALPLVRVSGQAVDRCPSALAPTNAGG